MPNSLFFNVDGSVLGSPGPAGIGGVLRDHMGKILCVFSSHIGSQDVILAELLAIQRACELFGSKSEIASRPITFLSDSKTAVSWILKSIPGCNSHDQIISNIRSWLDSFHMAAVEFRPRSTNSFADVLAKKGVQTGMDELWWSLS
jgi:ribonuclease HI